MTINSVTRMWSRTTSASESSDGKKFTKNYSTTYQVVHSADATDEEIETAPALPNLRDLLDGYTNVYCTKVALTQRGVVMSYVQVDYQGEFSLVGDNPTLQPPDYEYRPIKSEAEIDEDADGIPFCTTIGEPVYGITKPIADMVLRVRKNYLAFNGQLALQYMDSTNIEPFNVFGDIWSPGQAAMTDFSVKPVISANGFTVDYFSVTCEIQLRIPYRTVAARAWWARYRNEGMYVTNNVKVTLTGGGGSGAAGYAEISSGAVSAIHVTSSGRGYTSAPTVSITADSGSGATATATVSDGAVASVSVGSGGTGYKAGIVRAVDDNKEPVSKPVLLAANGTRLTDTNQAFWVERRIKQYSLNYTALGLL